MTTRGQQDAETDTAAEQAALNAAELAEPPRVNYARGFAWNVVFNFIAKATLAIVGIVIANLLGPGPFGIYVLLITIYNLAELMREAGLKQAYYNDPELTPEKFRAYMRLSVASGAAFGLVLLALAYPLAAFYRQPALTWCTAMLAFSVGLNGLSAIQYAALLKAGRFRDLGAIETGSTVAGSLLALILVWLGFGLFGLMMQLVTKAALMFVLLYRAEPLRIGNYDREAIRPIIRLCAKLVATDLLWMVYSMADLLLVPRRFGEVANGHYGMSRRLIQMPAELVFGPLHRTVLVAVGNRAGDAVQVGRAFARSLAIALLFLVPIYAALGLLARPLIAALLGPRFAPAATLLPILCVGEAVRSVGTFAGTALVASGRAKIPLFAWVVPYPVVVITLAILWDRLTPALTAWTFVTGLVLANGLVLIAGFATLEGWNLERGRILRAIACLTLTLPLTYAWSRVPLSPWPQLIGGAVALPVLHLAIIGTVFARNPFEYMSPRGLRRLKGTL